MTKPKTFLSYFVLFSITTVVLQANDGGFSEKITGEEVVESECKCENGYCEKDAAGKSKCVCFPEYGLITADKCKECGCGRGANCTIQKGWFADQVECICPKGIKKKADRRCEDPCENFSCQNGGKCKVDYRGTACECPPPYSGTKCEKDSCFSSPCKNGGICAVKSDGFVCNCRKPFSGKMCEIVNTIPPTFETSTFTLELKQTTDESYNVTSDHEKTTGGQLNYTFDFKQTSDENVNITSDFNETTYNFTELSYSTTQSIASSQITGCDCGIKSIACKFDDDGNKRCLCLHGFSQLGDTCSDCYCGQHSNVCFFDKFENKTCMCKLGYAARDGTCTATCLSDEDCRNGGTCEMDSNGDPFCACTKYFIGDKCEVSIACQNLEATCRQFHAVCVIIEGKPSCKCPPEKSFRLSSGICENICDSKTCVYGQCEMRGQIHVCRCDEGYTGIRCDTRKTSIDKIQVMLYIFISSLFVVFILAISMTIALRLKKRRIKGMHH